MPGRLAVVVSAVMMVVSAGLPLATSASARAESPGTQPQGGKPSAEHVCDTPRPGKVACFAMRRDGVGGKHGVLAADAPPTGYGPADLRSAYDLPDDGGEGRTVAVVVAYASPTAEADLAVYARQVRARRGMVRVRRHASVQGGSARPHLRQGGPGLPVLSDLLGLRI